MADVTNKCIPSKDIDERCNNWINTQEEHLYADDNLLNTKCGNDYDDYDTESEFDSVSVHGGKKRRLPKFLKKEILHLACEWKDCTFNTDSMESFVKHVADHIQQLQLKINEDGKEVYFCSWNECNFENWNLDEITCHVNYHAYHAKLKCIGSNIRGRVKLPKCYRDTDWKNIIDLPSPHICRWEECLTVYCNYQMYLFHVNAHMDCYPRGNNIKDGIECKWTGCKRHYNNVYKLKEHMRCHTKAKLVACPDCGATFASNTKFFVHCRRQIPLDVQGFKCSYCNKFYPTEGILRDHMRFHVFNYKCSLCDMSCESPASLAKHVRYRHVSTRNFPCQLCSHAAKSQQDLDSHMTVHTNGPNFSCHFDGCLYTCKGAYALDRHIERVHGKKIRWYCCHECPIKYQKSYRLTKHLLETHNLQLPNGHKRFQYTQEDDGCYRLQMVRYEGIDEKNLMPVEEATLSNKKYKVKLRKCKSIAEVEISEDVEDTSNIPDIQRSSDINIDRSMPIISNILISIDDVDADGNIIKSKIIETYETDKLPPTSEPPIILK